MQENGGITLQEFKERIKKCLTEMEVRGIDLMYVYGDSTHPGNLTYLTNYRPIGADIPGNLGYNGVFLLFRDGTSLLVADRTWYVDWIREESWVTDIVADTQGDTLSLSIEVLKKWRFIKGKIECDTRWMPTRFYKVFKENFSGYEIDEGSCIVSRLREIKSEKEIELITKGLEILAKANDAVFSMAKEGVREIDMALEVERVVMAEGADYLTSIFINAGRRSTIALTSPSYTTYQVKKGDMVLVSGFCCYKKYHSGLDRNFVIGEPSERQRKLAEIELKTLEESIRLALPGRRADEFMKPVYEDFAVPLLKEAGFSDYNLQGYVGHATGVASAEAPVLWKLDSTILKPGMPIHIEPGIYAKDPRIGGLRTADTILITDGPPRVLNSYPRRIGTLA